MQVFHICFQPLTKAEGQLYRDRNVLFEKSLTMFVAGFNKDELNSGKSPLTEADSNSDLENFYIEYERARCVYKFNGNML